MEDAAKTGKAGRRTRVRADSSMIWHICATTSLLIVIATFQSVHAFTLTRKHGVRHIGIQCIGSSLDPKNTGKEKEKGVLDFIFNPYESKIPKEIEKDIYAAEANTPAAQERQQRVGLYAIVAFTGILFAFFNGFLTELRSGPTPDGNPIDLDAAGFGWVYSNFLFEFIFTNRIGGFICLLGGGACGLLAEAEYDTRRINAEKIFDEMQRRRAEKERGSSSGAKQESKRPKRRSGKEAKRIGALSEVALIDSSELAPAAASTTEPLVSVESPAVETTSDIDQSTATETKSEGMIDKLKGFYEKADSMAATQALLLNKKLEDGGLIEKITDETGFKVIGKEAAAKLKEQNEKSKE
jgi:hypothetical protein